MLHLLQQLFAGFILTGVFFRNVFNYGIQSASNKLHSCGYGSIPINTIFRGMNIHLPAILMFTRGTRF